MSKSNVIAILTIKEAIEKIERYTSDLSSWEELKEDVETFDACLMNFVIIGESVL
jgi:uncharacterized protein with HEPN domain